MNITENQFNILRSIALWGDSLNHCAHIQQGSDSISEINPTLRSLEAAGLVSHGTLTKAGMQALEPYKVNNAVIMAAGLSSRFVPISYEKPKCLMKVHGEVMIERQIMQLKKAGIEEIIVVAGYKAEQLFYLEEAFGVRILINKEFASRNNHSTIMVAAKYLGNTLICSADDYFTKNPFLLYEYKPFYSCCYSHGPTKEWCMDLNPGDRIIDTNEGGSDAWFMLGHAYFDREFSQKFLNTLESVYDLPETAGKLWESVYIDHINDLEMYARRYPDGIIYEFDSLDEVREFDPLFLENIDSGIFDHIVDVLGCSKAEIRNVYPLKQGLTNLSCHFETDCGEWVYRHPGIGTEKLIDRAAEKDAQETAKRLGLDDTFVHENPELGWKISRFIPNVRNLDPHDEKQLKQAMEMARRLHEADVFIDREFNFYKEGKGYDRLLAEKGSIDLSEYNYLAELAAHAEAIATHDRGKLVLSHNDFFGLNLLLDDSNKLYLIDWEYAGMSDWANDLGTFVVTSQLDEDETMKAVRFYFNREPSEQEICHCFALIGLAGWCWYVWALLKESEGDYVGEWMYVYYRYAKVYLPKASKLGADLGITK